MAQQLLSKWKQKFLNTKFTNDNFTELYGKSSSLVYNLKPENYKYARRAIANTKSGISNTKILCIGDSTTAGFNEISGTNEVAFSTPKFLAQYLTAHGLQAGWQNCFGDHSTGDAAVCDARMTLGAGWALWGGSALSPCGKIFRNASNQNLLQFTPKDSSGTTIATDTCEIYYLDDASGVDGLTVTTGTGGITAALSGGTITMSSATAADNRVKVAVVTAPSLANNIWSVKKTTNNATQTFVMGFNAYNSANKELNILNFGAHGFKAGDFSASTQANYYLGSAPMVISGSGFYGAPLAFIDIGINDWTSPVTPIATFTANMATLITNLQAAGTDVVLVVPIPSSATNAALADQAAVSSAIYSLATTYNCGVVDISARWVSYAVSQPLSYYRAVNDPHGSRMGYSDKAMAYTRVFAALGAI